MPNPLYEKLFHISNLTYLIRNSGQLDRNSFPPVSFNGAGFLGDVFGFVDGPLGINAALVGEIDEGILIAFRGTRPPVSSTGVLNSLAIALDWAKDFDAFLTTEPWLRGVAPGAQIHDGFSEALNSLWDDILPVVRNLVAASGDSNLILTGHSKGGAMAVLAGARFSVTESPETTCQIVTFGAPKVGDQVFADFFDQHSRLLHTRFEFGNDIVPHLPPSPDFFSILPVYLRGSFRQWARNGYARTGTLEYFDQDGANVPDPDLNHRRRAMIQSLLPTIPPDPTAITDHFLWPIPGKQGYGTII